MGLGSSNQNEGLMCKPFFLSLTSFESPGIFHSLANPVFAIPKTFVAPDHFLVHDSVINVGTMVTRLPPGTASHKTMTAYFWT